MPKPSDTGDRIPSRRRTRAPRRAPQREPNRAVIAEEQIRCYELRLTGMSIERIAEATGIPRSTVHDRIQAEIRARVTPLADEVRKMELDRLDAWLAKLDAKIEKDPIRAIPVAVKVSESRRKLLGVDAPVQVEATVTEVTQEDLALAELVREAQMAAAVTEQQIRGEP